MNSPAINLSLADGFQDRTIFTTRNLKSPNALFEVTQCFSPRMSEKP